MDDTNKKLSSAVISFAPDAADARRNQALRQTDAAAHYEATEHLLDCKPAPENYSRSQAQREAARRNGGVENHQQAAEAGKAGQ